MTLDSNDPRFQDPGPKSTVAQDFTKPITSGQLSWGNAIPESPSTSIVEEKKVSLDQASKAKKAAMDPDYARRVVTADMMGNRLGDEQFIKDLSTKPRGYISKYYGEEVANNRLYLLTEYNRIADLKARERSTGDVVKDSTLDTLGAITSLANSVNAGVASGIDAATGTSIAPAITRGQSWITEKLNANKSDLWQQRAEQHGIEDSLDAEDNQAQFESDMSQATSNWDKALAQTSRFARGAKNTITNYGDDPIMAGSLVPEMVGYVAPMAWSIKGIALARVISQLVKTGMSQKAATSYLKTAAGKKLLRAEMTKVSPGATALAEYGGGYTQAVQGIDGYTQEELMESPQYRELLKTMSPEEARDTLTKKAGTKAGLVSGVIGGVTGKFLNPAFEAMPFNVARTPGKFGSSALSFGKTLPVEAVEETIQEGGNEYGAGIGIESVGYNVDPLEGVGEASGKGIISSLAGTGAMQAPGVALGTTVEIGRGIVEGAKKRIETVKENVDDQSSTGTKAQGASADATHIAGAALLESTATDPEQTTPDHTEASTPEMVVNEAVGKAIFVDEAYEEQLLAGDNAAEFAAAKEKHGHVGHREVINIVGEKLTKGNLSKLEKLGPAIQVLDALGAARGTAATAIQEALAGLPEDHPAHGSHALLTEENKTLEGHAAIVAAQEALLEFTKEEIDALAPVQALREGKLAPEGVEAVSEMLITIARYNPLAVSADELGLALDQIKPDTLKKAIPKQLATMKAIAEEIERSDTAAQEVIADQEKTVQGLSEEQMAEGDQTIAEVDSTIKKSAKTVQEEIHFKGNSDNGKLSYLSHMRKVQEYVLAGLHEEAADALMELSNFAQSNINKMGALQQAVDAGGDGKEKFSYKAYGNGSFIDNTGSDMFVNMKSSKSIALAQMVQVDTASLVGLYNTMLDRYGDQLGSHVEGMTKLKVPALDKRIKQSNIKAVAPKKVSVFQTLADKINKRLKKGEPKVSLEGELPGGAIAKYSGSKNIISINPDAVLKDFNNGLSHLMGEGGKASKQKAEVFKNIDVKHFRDFIRKAGVETYAKFILAHEKEHSRQVRSGEKYPSNWMDPKAIDMERRANKAGYAAIGYTPITPKQSKPKQVFKSQVTPKKATTLTDEKLNEWLNKLMDKKAKEKGGKLTGVSAATFAVLDAEMTRREDAADKKSKIHKVITEQEYGGAKFHQDGPILTVKKGGKYARLTHINNELRLVFEDGRAISIGFNNGSLSVSLYGSKNANPVSLDTFSNESFVPNQHPKGKTNTFKISDLEQTNIPKNTLNALVLMRDAEILNSAELDAYMANVIDGFIGSSPVSFLRARHKSFAPTLHTKKEINNELEYLTLFDKTVKVITDSTSKPEPKHITEMNAAAPAHKFSRLSPDQAQDFWDGIKGIEEFLGFNIRSLIKGIALQEGKGRIGRAFWHQGYMSLGKDVLDNIHTSVEHMHVMVHELGHMLDFKLASGNKMRSVQDRRLSEKRNGDLWREIKDAINEDAEFAELFNYALSMKTDFTQSQELFAELVAFTLLDRDYMMEKVPNATSYIAEVLGELGLDERVFGRSLSGESTSTSTQDGNGAPKTKTSEEIDPDTGESSIEETVHVEASSEPLSESFPNLIGRVTNRFLKAFQRRKEGSTMMSHKDPVAFILENLGSLSKHKNNNVEKEYSPKQKKALTNVLNELLPGFKEEMQSAVDYGLSQLHGRKDAKNRESNQDKLNKDSNSPVLDFPNLLALNMANQNEDGSYEMDERVTEAVFMAVAEWAVESSTKGIPNLKDDKINKLFKRDRGDKVTPGMRHAAMAGARRQAVLDDIARKTADILGVTENNSVTTNYTQGILRGLAATALDIANKQNMVTVRGDSDATSNEGQKIEGNYGKVFLPDGKGKGGEGSSVLFPTVSKGTSKIQLALNEAFETQPSMFSNIFLKDPDPVRFIGEAPTKVDQHQIRNRFARLKGKEKKVLKRLQDTPHQINSHLYSFMEALGRDNYAKLLGHKEVDEKLTNPDHYESIKGKNLSIMSGLESFQGYYNAAVEQSEDDNPSSVDIFFKWAISKVGRLQQQGPVTPQGNKSMRELVTATNATLDLSDPKQMELHQLTLAQSLDIPLEKLPTRDVIIKTLTDLLNSEEGYAPAIKILKEHLSGTEMTDDSRQQYMDAVSNAKTADGKSIKVTDKTLHALLTAARADIAVEQGGEAVTAFKTNLAMEADGKTDGPINAMVHMATERFTKEEIQTLAKGGYFFTNDETTLNDHIGRDSNDLYHVGADILKKKLIQKFANKTNAMGKQELAHGQALMRVMHGLIGDFDFTQIDGDQAEIEVGRNVVKNPLTVFLYGAGIKGISQKIANSMTKRLAEIQTEIAVMYHAGEISDWDQHPVFLANPGLAEDMNMIFNTRIDVEGFWKNTYYSNKTPATDMLENPTQYITSYESNNNLVNAVHRFFGTEMEAALDEATGGLVENMRYAQMASQIQAIAFKDEFDKQVAKLTEAKRASGEIGPKQLLSQEDVMNVFQAAMKLAPIYDTDAQTFHISTNEKYSSDAIISKSLRSKTESGSTSPSPGEAGVKVSPYTIIGTGDGRMILNIYVDSDGALNTSLPVFDGVELAADQIELGSTQINKAVHDGWMDGNIFQNLSESYNRMMSSTNFNKLSGTAQLQLGRALGLKKGVYVTEDHLIEVQMQLSFLSDKTLARKRAMGRLESWIDHMAGAMSPHHHEGEAVVSSDPQQIANQLNSLMHDEYDKIQAERDAAEEVPTIQEPSKEFMETVDRVGAKETGFEVTKVIGSSIKSLITRKNGTRPTEYAFFRDILKHHDILDEMTIYFGTSEELTRFRDIKFGNTLGDKPINAGQTSVAAGVIFIVNASPETMLHEALHAHTLRRLVAYYTKDPSMPKFAREAVERLEILMEEFMNTNFYNEPANVQAVVNTLKSEITQYKGKNRPAAAMSEFLSWSLTNQHLIGLTKRAKVYSPLMKIVGKVLHQLKQVIGITSRQGVSMFENIRFNAEILIAKNPDLTLSEEKVETDLILDQLFPGHPELKNIEEAYTEKLLAHIEANRPTVENADQIHDYNKQVENLGKMAKDALNHITNGRFSLDERQQLAFKAIHAAMMSGMHMDASAIRRANKLYKHVINNLTAKDFLVDPDSTDEIELSIATRKLNSLVSVEGIRKNSQGTSDLLATFMGLAAVDDGFKAILQKMEAPSDIVKEHGTMDTLFKSLVATITNLLTRATVTHKHMGKDVSSQLNVLSGVLSQVAGEKRLLATLANFQPIDKANDFVANFVESKSKKAAKWANTKKKAVPAGTPKAGVFAAAELVASLGSKEGSAAVGDTLTEMMNKTPRAAFISKILSDLRGTTASNQELMKLINIVKSQIDALRQDYREKIPEQLATHFSRKVTKSEYSAMHKIGRIDMLTLGQEASLNLLLDPSTVASEILAEEETLSKLAGNNLSIYKNKSKALAHYMLTKEVTSDNLLTNAHAIAKLLNENEVAHVVDGLEASIDRLTSLYAFQNLDAETKNKLKVLAKNENAGLSMIVGYLENTREQELSRIDSGNNGDVSRNNAIKGYIPTVVQNGHSLVIEDDSKHNEMIFKGYTRIRDYLGDPSEKYAGRRGVYVSSVGGRNTFKQGVAQSVHATYSGVDARTGQTKSGDTSGMIVGSKARRIAKSKTLKGDNLKPGAYLMPVFDKDGELSAYERPMPSEELSAVPVDDHMGRMLGVWSGRILEEHVADEFNTELIEVLKTIHEKETEGKTDKEAGFINLADPYLDNPVIKDAWGTMGWKLKKDAAEIFGESNYFPVRGDMVDDAIGYRAAGVTDPWTGITHLSKKTQENFRDLTTAIAGKNAYKWLAKGEGAVMDVVSYAKTTIVIRSVMMLYENGMSNNLHLLTLGMSPLKIFTSQRDKYVEISQYTKNREDIIKLGVNLTSDKTTPAEAARLNAQIQALEDANSQLSIAPLIEAGEFSTVSESLTEADVAIREGKWSDYIEKAAGKLPSFMGTIARNALVTKDTALFQGLNRAIQYSDFIAKAALYDHLMIKKGMTQEEALAVISEEFVNYNRLPGRGRDYLESVGALWFYNYKLRITKIAIKTIRERPLSALLYMGSVGPAWGIDTVGSGSLIGAGLDGRLPYSWGPGMSTSGITLNPTYNLLN